MTDIYLSQSRMRAYRQCDRLYAWQYLERLTPEARPIYLSIGSAVHKAMVVLHDHGGTDDAVANAVVEAEASLHSDHGDRISLPGDDVEMANALTCVRTLIPAYVRHWRGVGQLWRPLTQEVEFCIEVGEASGVYIVGIIDNLVTYAKGLWLVDYKTMGKLDLRSFRRYHVDTQLTSYVYAGTKQLSREAGKPVVIHGAIIDGLVKTKTPQFHREVYTRSVDELREFESEFVEKADEIRRKHERVDGGEDWKTVFPRNTDHCYNYSTCPFLGLCEKDTDVRRMEFVQREDTIVDRMRKQEER